MVIQRQFKITFAVVLVLNMSIYYFKDNLLSFDSFLTTRKVDKQRTIIKRSRIYSNNYIYKYHNGYSNTNLLPKTEERKPHIYKRVTVLSSNKQKRDYFIAYWTLQHTMRTDYKKILSPCKDKLKWLSYYPDRKPHRVTSANNSKISVDIQNVGQYSRLLIESYSILNTKKNEGGDSWRIHIYGTTTLPVTLIDNQDGSYEASFLIIEPGYYYADIYLDYTLCDGYKDPTPNWFMKGNSQGKYQPPGTLPGHERPYLEQRFKNGIWFEVKSDNYSVYKALKKTLPLITPHPPCLLWDGYGYWNNYTHWQPYITEPFLAKTSSVRQTGKGILWIYADSVGDFFYRANMNKPLCKKTFKQCNRTYNWVYNIQNNDLFYARTLTDSKDFSYKRIIDELKRVLLLKELDENSAIILNYGLHDVQDITLSNYENMIDLIIETIENLRDEDRFRAKVIWRTTTAIQKWKYGDPKSNARHSMPNRFLTTPRVQLFNALATSKMCEAGIKVLDVYPLTYSYPNGTGSSIKPWDAVHYEPIVFKSVENFLINYFTNEKRNISKPYSLILR